MSSYPEAGSCFQKTRYPAVKILKNMLNASSYSFLTTIGDLYLESLGISEQTLLLWWGFVDKFCGYSLRVDSVCQNLNIFYVSINWDFTLCPSSTVTSTFNPIRQYLQLLEIFKQISGVPRGIKQAISRKLVNISDCRVSSFLKTVPGFQLSRHYVTHFQTLSLIIRWQPAAVILLSQFFIFNQSNCQ